MRSRTSSETLLFFESPSSKGIRNGKCSHCGVNERRKGGRYCLECHRDYVQAHRQRRSRMRVARQGKIVEMFLTIRSCVFLNHHPPLVLHLVLELI
jgi:hypothetical protein